MPLQTNRGTQYLLDANNNEIFTGDYVKCISCGYAAIAMGDRRRIQGFDGENIVLNNHMSPEGIARYTPSNFVIAARHHPEHKRYDYMDDNKDLELGLPLNPSKEQSMTGATIQAAILIPQGMNKEEFFDWLLSDREEPYNQIIHSSPHKLKAAIEKDIHKNPSHRWFHINTQQISETAAPPIRTRAW